MENSHKLFIGTSVLNNNQVYEIIEFNNNKDIFEHNIETLTRQEVIQQIAGISNLEYNSNSDRLEYNGKDIDELQNFVVILVEVIDKETREHLGWYSCLNTEGEKKYVYLIESSIMPLVWKGYTFQNAKIGIDNRLKVSLLDTNNQDLIEYKMKDRAFEGVEFDKEVFNRTAVFATHKLIGIKLFGGEKNMFFALNGLTLEMCYSANWGNQDSFVLYHGCTDNRLTKAVNLDGYTLQDYDHIIFDRQAFGVRLAGLRGEHKNNTVVMTNGLKESIENHKSSFHLGLDYETAQIVNTTEDKIDNTIKKVKFMTSEKELLVVLV